MPRVIYRANEFDRVASHSWREREYEDLVFHRGGDIFPRWITTRFTADVVLPGGPTKRPDLALIDVHYRQWWVVEVELQHHSLQGHVLPQVEVFAGGRYLESHAHWIADRNAHLDRERLLAMMLGEPPRVLVVVDSPSTRWEGELRDVGVDLAVVEPFRDRNGDYLLRVNGHHPEPPGEILSRCSRHSLLRRMWMVQSPAALPPADADNMLAIDHDGAPARWRLVRFAGALMIQCERGDPLPDVQDMNLLVRADGSLEFVATKFRVRGRQ